jgi:dihydroorotate dehydrogenase
MYRALRPLLFLIPPQAAHDLAFVATAPLEHSASLRRAVQAALAPRDPALRRIAVRAMGLDFPSPLGLAGGFDKNALRPRALAALGFGHLELGTVTALPQAANPAPNLFRLPADRALVNRLGFPNEGASAVAARLRAKGSKSKIGVPVGLSIGKSRAVAIEPIEGAVADYLASFREARRAADFIVVNVSSPNTKDLRALQGPEIARALLGALARENNRTESVPLLVKIAPDLDDAGIEALLEVVDELRLDGVVATNTTVRRDGLVSSKAEIDAAGAGGLSGPPLRARALDVVRRVRSRLGRKATIIGVGGVENADHVLAFLRAGANLVQMYTGFIYGGPLAPSRIARDLAAAVERGRASDIAAMLT